VRLIDHDGNFVGEELGGVLFPALRPIDLDDLVWRRETAHFSAPISPGQANLIHFAARRHL
jgi:hypothetical protein